MSAAPVRFPYVVRDPLAGPLGIAPMLPVTLTHGSARVDVLGLLDSGSAVNVLPLSVGRQLGGDWNRLPRVGPLVGALSGVECRGFAVTGRVGPFPPVLLAFVWADTDAAPVILGQMNFLMEFDACFFRSLGEFEVRPSSTLP